MSGHDSIKPCERIYKLLPIQLTMKKSCIYNKIKLDYFLNYV